MAVQETQSKVIEFIKDEGQEVLAALVILISVVFGADLTSEAADAQELAIQVVNGAAAALIFVKQSYKAAKRIFGSAEEKLD